MSDRPKRVKVNDLGRWVGESHPQAKLTDGDVDTIRELYENGGFSYRALAEKFDCAKSTVQDIISCRRRHAVSVKFKTVKLPRRKPADATTTRHDIVDRPQSQIPDRVVRVERSPAPTMRPWRRMKT